MADAYLMIFICVLMAIGAILGFLISYFWLFKKESSYTRFFVSTFAAILIGFMFPGFIRIIIGMPYTHYIESKEKKDHEIANNELIFFKDAIAGNRSENEIRFYYTEKQLSTLGANYIRHELTLPKTEIDLKLLPVFLTVFENDPDLLGQLANRSEVPVDIKLKIADNPNFRAVWPMAVNTHTPPSVLVKLASYYDNKEKYREDIVIYYVRKNPNSPTKAKQICAILNNYDQDDFSKLFETKAEEIALWQHFANDKRENIRLLVAKNPKAPPNILSELAKDPSEKVSQAANKNLQQSGVRSGAKESRNQASHKV